MNFLLISILSSITITLIFKLMTRQSIDVLSCIIINYFTASLLGFVLTNFSGGFFLSLKFILAAALIGVFFIVVFCLTGINTKQNGMSITTLASKMSLIIPIAVSLLFDSKDNFTRTKVIALLATIISLYYAIAPNKGTLQHTKKSIGAILLLFICAGTTDSLVKVAQLMLVPSQYSYCFTTYTFVAAALLGFLLLAAKKQTSHLHKAINWKYGAMLGIANFCSFLFFMIALHQSVPGSSIFAINNVSIVCGSILIGTLFFKEQIDKRNKIGVLASLICLFYLSTI